MKWQLWVSDEMHPPGCPWGFDRMDKCPDAVNSAKIMRWSIDNGVRVTDAGRAFVEQMEAAGVDLSQPLVDLQPYVERT